MKETYPRDWKEYKFGDIFDFSGSLSISRANLSDEGICYLHYGDIHKSSDSFIDIDKAYNKIPKYNISLEKVDSKYLLKDGDIVFADASEDYEGIAKSVTVINKDNKPFITGLHTIVARDKKGIIDNNYKRYFLKDWNIRKQLMTLATGTSVLGISQPNLKKIKVFLPTKEEQNKIGLILSEWDKAIGLKEKLIEQIKEQKKGIMQKLLSGESRLPGFNNEWKEVTLSEFIKEFGDKTTISNQYPVLTSSRNGLMLQSDYYSNRQVTNENNIGYNIIPRNYYTYRSRSDDGKFTFNKNNIVDYGIVSYFYPVFKFTNQVDEDYMIELLNFNIEKKARVYVEGTAQKVLSFKKLGTFKFLIPDIEEQKAIALRINLSNKEIKLLDAEVENLKKQKQFLLQQLLTGKIRVKM